MKISFHIKSEDLKEKYNMINYDYTH